MQESNTKHVYTKVLCEHAMHWICPPQSAHYNHNYNWQPSSVTKQQFVYHYRLGSRLFLSYFYIAGIFHHFIPYSYSLFLHCWEEQPEKRPCFSELVVTIATLLEAVGGYLSLNVTDKIKLSSDTHLLYYNLDTAAQA